jgi:hypothetical protein
VPEHVQRLLDCLENVRPTPNGWDARCPAHGDNKPSLGIAVGDDGRILLRCRSQGCSTQQICQALSLPLSALFPPTSNGKGRRREVAVYGYRDELGELLYQVVRFEPKDFRQRRPDGHGGWVWSMKGIRRVPYRLPELLAAAPEPLVWIVEGEKDADRLAHLDLVSTTNAGGAGKWATLDQDTVAQALGGRQVVIVPDDDPPGHKHAEDVANRLQGVAATVKVVSLPSGKDVSDWLERERPKDPARALAALATSAPAWSAGQGGAELPAEGIDSELSDDEPASPGEPEPAPFPVEVYPPSVAQFIRELSAAMDCPPDLAGVFTLGLSAAAIGASRALGIKPGWEEVPRLYIVAVAHPGMGKTPTLNAVAKPHYDRQRHESERFEREYRQWKEADDGTDPPRRRHVYASDATVERAGSMMEESPRGFGIIRDEFASLITGLNQYKAAGRGNDRDFYTQVWSGAPVRVDRKNRQAPLIVRHPYLSIVGGLQPDRLTTLLPADGNDDGFVDRLLFAYPHGRVSSWNRLTVSDQAQREWTATVNRLLDLPMVREGDSHERPFIVKPSSRAFDAWESWVREHEAEMRDPDFPMRLMGAYSKLRAHMLRFALVLHELRAVHGLDADQVGVSDTAMVGAAALAAYFKAHLRRAHGRLGATKEDLSMQAAAEWLKRQQTQEITPRMLLASRVAGARKAAEAIAILRGLAEHGLGQLVSVRNVKGRVRDVFIRPDPGHTAESAATVLQGLQQCNPMGGTTLNHSAALLHDSREKRDREPGEEG